MYLREAEAKKKKKKKKKKGQILFCYTEMA